MVFYLLKYLSIFFAILFVLPIHEFAHAFTAVKCGDNTPKYYNRYTLNPFAHFDIVGLACFILFRFGWAKPVPVNPNNFKHPRRDTFLVAISGVAVNFIMAFILFGVFKASLLIPEFGYFTAFLQNTIYYAFIFNLSFCVFNLIPIYPLDGFKAVEAFTNKSGNFYNFVKNYGIYLLYFLFALSFLADMTGIRWFGILDIIMNKAVNIIATPIRAFWGVIF